jgi:RNA polymerase sigma factor (sigma-70 family)
MVETSAAEGGGGLIPEHIIHEQRITQYQALIINRARQYHRGWVAKAWTLDELQQAGSEAVWEASKTFRDDRGAKFGTYVTHVVNHAFARIAQFANRGKRRGFTVTTSEGEDGEAGVLLVDKAPTVDTRMIGLELRVSVRLAVDSLEPRLKDIIERRYWRDQTLAEIGESYGLTRERIRQLEAIAFDELRPQLRDLWVGAPIGEAA